MSIKFDNRQSKHSEINEDRLKVKTSEGGFSASANLKTSTKYYYEKIIVTILILILFPLMAYIIYNSNPDTSVTSLPDKNTSYNIFDIKWWFSPLESNSARRPVPIIGAIKDFHVSEDGNHIWMIGALGQISYSNTRGQSWVRQKLQDPIELILDESSVVTEKSELLNKQAINKKTQKATAENILSHVTSIPDNIRYIENGGPLENYGVKTLESIHFINSKTGWVAGSKGYLASTLDGGKTWRAHVFKDIDRFRHVSFSSDGKRGWLVSSSGEMFSTTDSGTSWSQYRPHLLNSKEIYLDFSIRSTNSAVLSQTGQFALLATSTGHVYRSVDFGITWVKSEIKPQSKLMALYFLPDKKLAWVGGDDGKLYFSQDGGENWKLQKDFGDKSIRAIHFMNNGSSGWVAGEDGLLYSTQNAGKNWKLVETNIHPNFNAMHMPEDGGDFWLVGSYSSVLNSSDKGKSWQTLYSHNDNRIRSVYFIDDLRGWRSGSKGVISRTVDGGNTWLDYKLPTIETIYSLYFLDDGKRGWAVGYEGVFATTDNGGVDWSMRTLNEMSSMRFVYFISEAEGFIVGKSGMLHTLDGGNKWEKVNEVRTRISEMDFDVAGKIGIAAADDGFIYRTTNGGESWKKIHVGQASNELHCVYVSRDGRNIWTAGKHGVIYHSGNSGLSWDKLESGTSKPIYGIYFLNDNKTGWAIGFAGTFLKSKDGGFSWQKEQRTNSNLSDIYFDATSKKGWVVGSDLSFFSTRDSGNSWTEQYPYSRYPAPWIFISLCLAFAFITLVIYQVIKPKQRNKDESNPDENSSVDDILVSDRPLAPGDPGAQAIMPMVNSIANFIGNKNTQLPLTLAITGKWGSGKSSVMNLLREELNQRGFKPVWFNAWHHQNEKSLLDSLLNEVRNQAVMKWYNPEGLLSKFKILKQRGMIYQLLALIPAIIIIAFVILLFDAEFRDSVSNNIAYNIGLNQTSILTGSSILQLEKEVSESAVLSSSILDTVKIFKDVEFVNHDDLVSGINKKLNPYSLTAEEAQLILKYIGHRPPPEILPRVRQVFDSLSTVFIVFLGMILAAIRGMGALGFSMPLFLTSLVSKKNSGKEETGTRQFFEKEFEILTNTIGKKLIIIIDDLDRCSPDKLIEILQTINFLVSAGECTVVMGMDYGRVRDCVGLQFKEQAIGESVYVVSSASNNGYTKVAEADKDEEQSAAEVADIENKIDTESLQAKRDQQLYGHQYLQKMIGVEVPVEQVSMSFEHQVKKDAPQSFTKNLIENLYGWRGSLLWLAIIAVICTATTYYISSITPTDFNTSKAFERLIYKEPEPKAGNKGNNNDAIQATKEETPAEKPVLDLARDDPGLNSNIVLPDYNVNTSMQPIFWFTLFLMLTSILIILKKVYKLDSALDVMRQYLTENTRYTADSDSFIDSVKHWKDGTFIGKDSPRSIKRFINRMRYFSERYRSESNDEGDKWVSNMVALSALHHIDPCLVEGEQSMVSEQLPNRDDLKKAGLSYLEDDEIDGVINTLKLHINKPGNDKWPPDQAIYKIFKKISSKIHIDPFSH